MSGGSMNGLVDEVFTQLRFGSFDSFLVFVRDCRVSLQS